MTALILSIVALAFALGAAFYLVKIMMEHWDWAHESVPTGQLYKFHRLRLKWRWEQFWLAITISGASLLVAYACLKGHP